MSKRTSKPAGLVRSVSAGSAAQAQVAYNLAYDMGSFSSGRASSRPLGARSEGAADAIGDGKVSIVAFQVSGEGVLVTVLLLAYCAATCCWYLTLLLVTYFAAGNLLCCW